MRLEKQLNMNLHEQWIVGFVDGEGCFSFSIFKSNKMKNDFQIQGEFTVVQHLRGSIRSLTSITSIF